MQPPAPDLISSNHAAPPSATDKARRDDDDEAHVEAEKLEQLADRVSAARSVY